MSKFSEKRIKKSSRFANEPVNGILSINNQGFGFVKTELSDYPSVFIPPGMLGAAITGDTVEVSIDPQSDPGRPSGRVTAVLARRFREFVGCLVPKGDGWAIRPLRHEMPAYILLEPSSCRKARPAPEEGVWALAEFPLSDRDESSFTQCRAVLKSVLGRNGDVTSDLDAVCAEYGLPEMWDEKEEKRAEALEPLKVRREDCTGLTCVTIDPVDARDYDDALSCQPGPHEGQLTVGVHIADVACYIRRNGHLDRLARKRGFTSYLPGRTIPMLPKALANVKCSLQAGVPRLAHTVFITFDEHTGEILSSRRCHTTINVTQRLCYEEVQRYFDGGELEASQEVRTLLDNLGSLSALLRHHRAYVERFLPMNMPEIRVLCSGAPPAILGIQAAEDNPSHQLVEEFMLAANQCVAEELLSRRIPGIFRNHQAPDSQKLGEFVETATIMMGKKVKSLSTRTGIVRFLRAAAKSPMKDVLMMSFLRQLPRADYGLESMGHFGLGKERYCHFTSPIRRYTDTLVHQQLLALDCRRELYTPEAVATIAAECTALEYNCDQAAFAAQDRMKIRLLRNQLDEKGFVVVRGEVCRTAKSGAQIYLPEYGMLAFVNDDQLPRRAWSFDARRLVWTNTLNGDRLFVTQDRSFTVDVADPIRGELYLRPLAAGEKPGRKSAAKRRAMPEEQDESAGLSGRRRRKDGAMIWPEPEPSDSTPLWVREKSRRQKKSSPKKRRGR
ncbi:MAG: VacB/RNase II family 3'-5' exoribonuclease [Victivallales bacterium]|nr:VacB/RNase II family 3'-5' exoribonuclease [Victivallales bacterium]